MKRIVFMASLIMPVLTASCTGSGGQTLTTTINSTLTKTMTFIPISTVVVTPAPSALSSATSSVITSAATSLPPLSVSGLPAAPSSDALAQAGFAFPAISRITVQELKQRIDRNDVLVVVDARDDTLFAAGHIPGTINIPYISDSALFIERVKAQLKTLPVNQVIVFYGSSPIDQDSATLAMVLISLQAGQQTKNILVLWKGYSAWTGLGYSIESNSQ